MVSPKRFVQTVEEFQADAMPTLQRLEESDSVEELTRDGEVKAVVLSPRFYAQLLAEARLTKDIAAIKEAREQYERGDYTEGFSALEEIKRQIMDRAAS
ncbi:MAG: hypothetical protein AAF750_14300 [Planctomycetota bacterium]